MYLATGYTNKEPWIDMDVAMVARETFQLQNRIARVMSIHAYIAGHTHPDACIWPAQADV